MCASYVVYVYQENPYTQLGSTKIKRKYHYDVEADFKVRQ